MKDIFLIDSRQPVHSGSVVRLFGVDRLDVIKLESDKGNAEKLNLDFYDYMVVDVSLLVENTFLLVNITTDHASRGSILCKLELTEGFNTIIAGQLQSFFGLGKKIQINLNL